jgi:hypothetical protein
MGKKISTLIRQKPLKMHFCQNITKIQKTLWRLCGFQVQIVMKKHAKMAE